MTILLRSAVLALPLLASPALALADINITLDHGAVYQTKKSADPTQGFIQIHNSGSDPDMLIGWNCSIAATTTLVGADGQKLDSLIIPPGQTVTLSAKGPHLALQDLSYNVEQGSILPCSFTFQDVGQIGGYLNSEPAPKAP
jgi:copper(I)-binding protein